MRKAVSLVVIFVFIVVFAGCATLPMDSNIDKPVSMTKMEDTAVKTFSSNTKAFWIFWGAAPISLPTVDGVVTPHVSGHSGVQNLKITTQYSLIDLIVTSVTQGIITMRTVTIEGEIYD